MVALAPALCGRLLSAQFRLSLSFSNIVRKTNRSIEAKFSLTGASGKADTRISIAAYRRSVFARLRSRDTATLAEWMNMRRISIAACAV
jgi:hypothetical protein